MNTSMLEYSVTADDHDATVRLRREDGVWKATVNGQALTINVIRIDRHEAVFEVERAILRVGFLLSGSEVEVSVGGDVHKFRAENQLEVATRNLNRTGGGGNTVAANMPGKVVAILVKEGDEVKQGQGVVVLEAMKMENELKAPRDGKIKAIKVKPGQAVEQRTVLVELE